MEKLKILSDAMIAMLLNSSYAGRDGFRVQMWGHQTNFWKAPIFLRDIFIIL